MLFVLDIILVYSAIFENEVCLCQFDIIVIYSTVYLKIRFVCAGLFVPRLLIFSLQERVIALNTRLRSLYLDNWKVSTGVSSFDLHDKFVVFTTDSHTCQFIPLDSDPRGKHIPLLLSKKCPLSVWLWFLTKHLEI